LYGISHQPSGPSKPVSSSHTKLFSYLGYIDLSTIMEQEFTEDY